MLAANRALDYGQQRVKNSVSTWQSVSHSSVDDRRYA